MERPTFFKRPAGPAYGVAVLLGLLAGCYPHEGVIGGALPEPNGTFVHEWQNKQAAKAEASDFVFFLDEWYMGGGQLGPYGHYHLTQVIRRLPKVPFPVVVEPGADAAQNEARRRLLADALAKSAIPDADQRVIIAYPDAEGLYGEEAPRIFTDMLSQRRNSGLLGQGFRSGFGGGFNSFGMGGNFGRFGGFVPGCGTGFGFGF
jgi:hypothetical protein